MGASQSKRHCGRLGLGEASLASMQDRKSRLVSCSEAGNTELPGIKQRRHQVKSRKSRLRGLRRTWRSCTRRVQELQPSEGCLSTSVPGPWLDKPQQQKALVSCDASNGEGVPRADVSDRVSAPESPNDDADMDFVVEAEEFIARSVHLPEDPGVGGPLYKAYANWLPYMEEEVIAALGRHPHPDEALTLMYVCCSSEPLPVEPTLEPSADILAFLFPGTYFKVLDIAAYSTSAAYLIRLKTAEGWVTGASVQMMRLTYSARFAGSRASIEEAFAPKIASQQSAAFPMRTAVCSSHHQPGDPVAPALRGNCNTFPGDTQEIAGEHLEADGARQPEDSLPSTCWGTVHACRATLSCNFLAHIAQTEERMSYAGLSQLASASEIQGFESALVSASPGLLGRSVPCKTAGEAPQLDKTGPPCTNLPMSPMEHPFMLFRVAGPRALPVSVTPHLGSPIVGRLLRRQVFPVFDACLACCASSCGRSGGEGDCVVAGLGALGRGGRDILQTAPPANVCGRKARRHLSYFSRSRRVQLRVRTIQGWVTLDCSVEKVDECETLYEPPVLYEIVADGYLVNVRALLEIEGPVRRTVPPSTLVEVFERKVNAEGLMRLRLVDGWINERRKGTDDGGLLFAIRVEDQRATAFRRQIAAVGFLLPALCSTNSRVRTAAATWVAASAAQSSVASSALMEEVDTARVEEAVKRCACCYCRGSVNPSEREALETAGQPSCSDSSSQRRPGDWCMHSREAVSCGTPEGDLKSPRELASKQHPPLPGPSASPAVSCRLRPLAARDLLLAESPVIDPFPQSSSRIAEGQSGTPLESADFVEISPNPPSLSENEGPSVSGCHRGRGYLDQGANFAPDSSDPLCSVCERDKEPGWLWSTLYSLVKAASALPGGLSPRTGCCPVCLNHEVLPLKHIHGCSSRVSEHSGDEEEQGRTCRMACPGTEPGSDSFPCRCDGHQRASRRRPSGIMDDKLDSLDHTRDLRKCRTNMPLSTPAIRESHFLHCVSSPELGMGLTLSHDLAVRREALSPTDPLYRFCIAAVYSSLTEHREPIGHNAIYRPPVGSFLPSPNQQNSVVPTSSMQQCLLAAYKTQLLSKKGKPPVINPNRCNSFYFHQPPIILIHKIERICNGFLVRRYLHERSMLMLMNPKGGCRLDEAIPNPLLKVYVSHPSQASLNEYFLFHGCTEERAGLIAISGFDFRRGGENGGKLFGVGTYFSPNASKADLYTRPNDFSTRAAGHLPITAVALHIGLPSLPLMAARLAQPPTVGLPAAPPPLPGIPTRTGGVGRPGAAGDPTTNKFAGNLRFGRGSWLGGGRNNTNSTLTSPASSNPSLLQRDGTAKRDKEKGGLRAVCAKLARQGGGSNGNRPKDSLVPASQPANSQKGSTSQQANTQQHPKTHDSTGSRTQQASATGTFGSSANFMAAPSPRCLLLARVCLGEVYKAMYPMPDARMPPNKPDPVAAKLAYDSVMAECRTRGGVVDGVEFVVFERAQALPQFIVTYSHASHCQCAECHRQLLQ